MGRKGMTAVELIVAVSVLAAIVAILLPRLFFYVQWRKEMETRRRLRALKVGLLSYYKSNAGVVDYGSEVGFRIRVGNTEVVLPDNPAPEELCQAMEVMAGGYLALSAFNACHDAFNTPFTVRIARIESPPYAYHVIAVISPGKDKVFSPDTRFDPSTGELTLGAGDMGFVISGLSIEVANYQKVLGRLDKVVAVLEGYFFARYAADPAKDIAVDRFINTRRDCTSTDMADPNGIIPNTCCVMGNVDCWIPLSLLAASLGLKGEDVYTPWKGPDYSGLDYDPSIEINTGGNEVRNPDAPNPGQALPPYTAGVRVELPWALSGSRQLITVSAVGKM